ncbi:MULTISPECIES: NADH:ubiquinone reductase (Na(+)-transporting) subunit F [Cycloclasticus]|jgi:NAD(P)H-flavin reductase|uniref:2-polyprenylphenol hydroxylase-related flavodoxin oxidoreductase n=1 Tax=Cycloclasticus zancles 78-ME TaxID=1198232 RepID=S5TVI6_9GAMM|nr:MULTISPECIES: 2Fe-2S iron-sulfur cluster binding domain-containing protein [Cycloclasticus]AFT67701.1 Xylene monooxygenase electron transfer component [Cycloclasticus sp. P1]AGS39130.1 2-polyprenylphenol hydroxylase-related flavodoxin oxidoreductase [Cycloclasticus zancles 78-ME]MBV1897755.1 2Fe-2S iron-sulfur cluster binding domain-containing protein [Cycloclasticus sp.]MDF1828787.1 2Fe-2S iron-sulfur cluster binding domain-containing protein [Cycloclasticus pugetii]
MKKLFGLFGGAKKTPLKATIQPSGKSFEVPKNNTLLQTALNEGVNFPFHCTVGTCGNCRCKLLDGEVKAIMDFSYTLSEPELDEGYILACQSLLKTDVIIELEADANQPKHSVKTYKGTITDTHMHTHDIMEVTVELDQAISFTAGQFADIGLEGFSRHRSYSFANAPAANGQKTLSFHVRNVPGGDYTQWLFEKDRKGEAFELHGPSGAFWLRTSDAPILAIAGGSGMAPLKSILEDALKNNINRPVTYLFGARAQRDLYCLDDMKKLTEKWSNSFKFVPVLSEEPEDSDWTGKRGLVTDFIDDETIGFSVSDSHAYLCGPPGMIDATLVKLEEANISLDNIHYDKFLDSRQLES